jgi:hypothetical protein
MSLPFTEDYKKRPKRRYGPKTKLPTQATSKGMRKCPICSSPYFKTCLNCYYKNAYNDDLKEKPKDPGFTKASDIQSAKPDEL